MSKRAKITTTDIPELYVQKNQNYNNTTFLQTYHDYPKIMTNRNNVIEKRSKGSTK